MSLWKISLAAWIVFVSCGKPPVQPLDHCQKINGMPGPEDFDYDRAGNRLLVSSQERRKQNGGYPEGAIFAVDLSGKEAVGTARALRITGRDSSPFHPHGISLFAGKSETLLYVVAHPDEEHNAIEVFRVLPDSLAFKERLTSEVLVHPNDVASLANGELYVTNDHGWTGGLAVLEDLFALPRATVVHYREGKWSFVADGFRVANGIAVNRALDRLYVGATRDRGIHVYVRNPADGSIGKELDFIDMGSGTDNLMWESDEILDVAGHYSMFRFIRTVKDPTALSPNDITRVNVTSGKKEMIFATDGSEISGASTGLVLKGKLYISQVFEPFILACDMK